MKLTKAMIRRYRSIEDLGTFRIESDVTCLVGKNESGKTATLQALYKSRPVDSATFNPTLDFPSHLSREVARGTSVDVTVLTYELEAGDVVRVEAELGPGALDSTTLTVTAGYNRENSWGIKVNEEAIVRHLRADIELPASTEGLAAAATTVAELLSAFQGMDGPTPATTAAVKKITSWRDSRPKRKAIDLLVGRQPRFVYFGDYDVMPGKVSIPDLIVSRDAETLSRGQEALLALLKVSGVELEEFLEPESHEHLIRSLENAANAISVEVFQYWTQNKDLRVKLEILASPEASAGPRAPQGPFLQIRVHNNRHSVSVPFDERSRGFVWFFSFLAYFSELEEAAQQPLILLLDEPGLSLHATAQNDLLRFIDDRLAGKHQVIFTTHSPFMVDAHNFQRVRTVVDDAAKGTLVSEDVLRVDGETAFPLHAALGIELTQTLFVGPHVLFLEGPSDVVFLQYLSDQLQTVGRPGLDERWVLVPGGGITKLPAFLTLFGANHLTVAALTDSSESNQHVIRTLQSAGKLYKAGLVQVGEILGKPEADVEDLLEPRAYLDLFNSAYQGVLAEDPLSLTDLPDGPRLVLRIEAALAQRGILNGRYNHYSPAAALLRTKPPTPSKNVLDRAERLFAKLNEILKREQ